MVVSKPDKVVSITKAYHIHIQVIITYSHESLHRKCMQSSHDSNVTVTGSSDIAIKYNYENNSKYNKYKTHVPPSSGCARHNTR